MAVPPRDRDSGDRASERRGSSDRTSAASRQTGRRAAAPARRQGAGGLDARQGADGRGARHGSDGHGARQGSDARSGRPGPEQRGGASRSAGGSRETGRDRSPHGGASGSIGSRTGTPRPASARTDGERFNSAPRVAGSRSAGGRDTSGAGSAHGTSGSYRGGGRSGSDGRASRPERGSGFGPRSGAPSGRRDDAWQGSGDPRAAGSAPRRADRDAERRVRPGSDRPDFAGRSGGAGSAGRGSDRNQARRGAPARGGSQSRSGSDTRSSSGYRRDSAAGSGAGRPSDRVEHEQFERTAEPAIPAGADPKLLDPSVRSELRSLAKLNAEAVGGHLVAAGQLLDSDPHAALAHARAARRRAARVGVVREAVGIAAYHAEEWAEALTELRTARRITGDGRTLPMIADCERALGRPQQALRALDDPEVRRLDPETRAELLIVVAGARRDLGQLEAALGVLSRGGLDRSRPNAGSIRLWYAYADTLQALERQEDAAQWFAAAAALDVNGETDAAERAADLL